MSLSTITNAKNGTTRSIYTVEGIQTIPFNESYEPNFTDQEKTIIEGLAQRFEIDGDNEQLYQFMAAFCVLADYKKTKTHTTGRAKKSNSVETKKRADFKSRLPEDRSTYEVNESYDGWSVVKGEVGTLYFDGRVQKPDGKGALPYYYTFEDACVAAEGIDCGSITLNESGYSLRIGQIPIKVGIKKGATETKVSHPERQIMSWAKDSAYPLKYSRTEPVNDKRKAKSREAENDKSIMAGQLAELKALKAGKSVVAAPVEAEEEEEDNTPLAQIQEKKKMKKMKVRKPEPEPEEEEEEEEEEEDELDVEPVEIDGEEYYWEEKTNKIYEMDSTQYVGYYSEDQTKITNENELKE